MKKLLLAILLLGCSGARPEPLTGSECSTDGDVGETCWTCASDPACAWCPSTDPNVRGCYDRTGPFLCGEGAPVIRVSDRCNDLPEGTDRR